MVSETISQWGLSGAFRRLGILIFVTTLGLAAPARLSAQSVVLATNSSLGAAIVVAGEGSITPHLTGSAFVEGKIHTLTAKAGKGFLFANWTSNGATVSASARYKFSVSSNVVIQANFVTNPFLTAGGAYRGLFYVTSNATEDSSGLFAATVGSSGAFSAKLQFPNGTYSWTGHFGLDGSTVKTISRPGLPALAVQLQLDFGSNALNGTVSDGIWTADLSAMPEIYSRANPAPQAGKYTLLISGSTNAAFPGGNGFGSLTVSAAGAINFAGTLGDGAAVSCAGSLTSAGQWPFYSSLYGGKGSIFGWLEFTNDGIGGEVAWFKLPAPKAKFYATGFTNSAEVLGSAYHHTNGVPALDLTGGEIWLANGGLQNVVTQAVGQLQFNAASGLFKGVVTNVGGEKRVAINGAVLQNEDLGGGLFVNSAGSGSVFVFNSTTADSTTNVFPAADSNQPATNTISKIQNSISSFVNNNSVPSTPPPAGLLPVSANVDGISFAQQQRLAYFPLNSGTLAGDAGQAPLMAQASAFVPAWCGQALSMNSPAASKLQYNVYETAGPTNFNCANGTIRFWFQPNWSTGDANAPSNGACFFGTGAGDGAAWGLFLENEGPTNSCLVQFSVQTAGQQYMLSSFQSATIEGQPITFRSNMWYQIALAYSPSNIALYTNGVLLATGNRPPTENGWTDFIYDWGNGIAQCPSPLELTGGFSFGCLFGQQCAVNGQLAELEMFNYPLSPQEVAGGFPTFANATNDIMRDSDYDGRSDLLEQLVDGTDPSNPKSVVQCRLGYWRFDTESIQTEGGQPPLSWNDVNLAPSWSGTALYINSDPASQVTYWDVFTNGWANINCRQGCLRFWFKPNWNNAPKNGAPFVYVGNTNSALSQWSLAVNPSGQITLTTASNGFTINNLVSGQIAFDTNHWTQIALNYGADGTYLFTNGVLAATGIPVTIWPSLPDRNLGMVIGNNTAYNDSINGQFDEIETFNYELAPADILASFQTVQMVDSDLNGVPDFLEELALPVSRPFLGAPVVVTGTIEAEQFDMGGPGVAYSTLGGNPASSYRPTGLFITNCDDLGLGYCLDNTRAGEWAQYTIQVLSGQTYTIETRTAGIGTNGVFECDFYNTNTGFATNTGPLTLTTTNWTNVCAVVNLTNGIYTMKLRFLTNGSDGAHVGRFNYISIYPWWPAGFASAQTNLVSSASLSTNNDWEDAANNAAVIQAAVNEIGSAGGGTVVLPPGTYYVSQASPNETNSDEANAAISILTNNIEIAGAGETNTTLIAYNRATTVFSVGRLYSAPQVACANVVFHDMTIQAQPHLAVANVTNTVFEQGQLIPGPGCTGALTKVTGYWSPFWMTRNVVISNCQFIHADFAISLLAYVSNCVISHCDFQMWGGTNVYTGFTNNAPTNTPNTAPYVGGVAIIGYGATNLNINILDNTYNGNTNLVPSKADAFGYVNTNNFQYVAPDGFVNLMSGGNVFIARNLIRNNSLEGIQFAAGPNSVVGNVFDTLANDTSCCALCDANGGWPGVAGFGLLSYSTCFIGNYVHGGRNGQSLQGSSANRPYTINFSGNELSLYPPIAGDDTPGTAVGVAYCAAANILGNTLDYGGHGAVFGWACSNAIIMNNNFAGATYRSVGLMWGGGSLDHALILNNILGQGSTFHVGMPVTNNFGWFLYQNDCLNQASQTVPAFCDPINSAAHVMN